MNIGTVIVPDYRLEWSDQYKKISTTQEPERMLDGSLVVNRTPIPETGQKLTLKSGKSGVTRVVFDEIYNQSLEDLESFDIVMTDGSIHTVMWDYQLDGSHIEGSAMIRDDNQPSNQSITNITLRFLYA